MNREFFQKLLSERKFKDLDDKLETIKEENPLNYYLFKIELLRYTGEYTVVITLVEQFKNNLPRIYEEVLRDFIIYYIEALIIQKEYETAKETLQLARQLLRDDETSEFSRDLVLTEILYHSASSQYRTMKQLISENRDDIDQKGNENQKFGLYNFTVILQMRLREFENIEDNLVVLAGLSHSTDKNRFHYLLTYVEYLWYYNKFETILPLLEEMETLGKEFQSMYYQFYVTNYNGIQYGRIGDFKQSLKYFQRSLRHIDNSETKRKAGMMINIGITYSKLGDFSNAISYFRIVEEINNNTFDLFIIYDNLGICYLELGDNDTALENLDKAIELKQEKNTPNLLIYSYIHKSRVLIELGRFEEAVKLVLQCSEINENVGSIDQQIQINTILGDILLRKGLIMEAYNYLDQSYQQLDLVEDPFLVSKLLIKMGEYYYNINDISAAIGFFERARVLIEKQDNKLSYAQVIYQIYTFYQRIGVDDENEYYLKEGLEIARNFEHVKLTAQLGRAVAEQYFIHGKINQAKQFLNDSIQKFREFNNVEEMNKSLQLSAIIAIEEEKFEEAIEILEEISKERMNFNNPILLSETIFYLIIVDLNLEKSELVEKRLETLKGLKIKTDYFLISQFYTMSKALYLIQRQTIKELAEAQSLLESLIANDTSNSYIGLLAEKHLFDMLLLDYRFNQDNDLLDSLFEKSELMYQHGRKENNYNLITSSYILKFKLYHELQDYSEMNKTLETMKEFVEEKNLTQYQSMIDQFQVLLEGDTDEFEDRSYEKALNLTQNLQYLNNNINQIFHSTPRLSILFYLLPREDAGFKDLAEVTGLTPGNLDRHCKRLTKAGFIEKFKKIVDDRIFTYYRITQSGIIEYRKYRNDLKKYLDVQLI